MRRARIAPLAAAAVAVLAAAPARATPTCPGPDRFACGGRIIPEPSRSTGFLTYAEWTGAMTELAKEHPDRVRFDRIGRTAANRPLYAVTVTDFADPAPMSVRTGLYFNGDIHGDERDGTEGFARVIEDLAESKDPAVAQRLRREVLVFTDANPDGWQTGDVPDGLTQPGPSGPQYTRENGAGHDLNREWPVVGFQNPTTFPLADPEVQDIVEAHGNVLHRADGLRFGYAFDVHGSATPETPPNAQLMLDVLLSAGQLSLTRALEQVQWAQGYMDRLAATSSDDVLATLTTATGQRIYRVGDWDTSWDIYGYLVSGGFADWMGEATTGLGADVAATIELFVNGEPGQENTYAGFNQLTEAANVHAMRVAVGEAMDLAASPQHAELRLPGPAGWIPNRTVVSPGAGPGPVTPVGIPATRPPARTRPATTDEFFEDLSTTGARLTRVATPAALAGKAVVVMAQDAHLDDQALLSALRAYVQGGGTLVLTDGALRALPALAGLPAGAVAMQKQYAGYVDPADPTDPLLAGARPLSRQTYEPVPVGYAIDNSFSSATSATTSPVWTVDRGAWEAAGGHTAGTTGTGRTSLGELAIGKGRIRILGALLPDPSTAYAHPFGVDSYGVTYWGYRLFANLLGGSESLAAGPPPPAAARVCRSRRRVVVYLPRALRSGRVYVGRRLVARLRDGHRHVAIDLRGRGRGAVRVRIVGVTRRERRVVQHRTFHPCTRRALR